MKIQKIVGLTLVLMLFVSLVYADIIIQRSPGDTEDPGARAIWSAQRIQFSNISSLGKFELHLQLINFRNRINKDIIITKDTTYFMPEHSGAPSPRLRFFALSDKKSTDTVEISYTETDIDFNFSPVKKNKLQFTRKPIKSSLSIIGVLNNSDNSGNGLGRFTFNAMHKLLLSLSLSAIAGLLFLFMFYKKKNLLNTNSNPSA